MVEKYTFESMKAIYFPQFTFGIEFLNLVMHETILLLLRGCDRPLATFVSL